MQKAFYLLGPLFFLGCGHEDTTQPIAPTTLSLNAFKASEWSEPVHLGAPVSSASTDLGPQLSPDGLSIYVGSERSGGHGGVDIWAVRRVCMECPWSSAVSININSEQSDGGPAFSADGHYMFFSSDRSGGHGGDDIWVAYREDVGDDLHWEAPINLGPGVNTSEHETGPSYVTALHAEGATLYFVRGVVGGGDIYRALVTLDGETVGDAEEVAELNTEFAEGEPAVSSDGKEIFFHSARPGVGQTDIWVATRQYPHGQWSDPVNLSALNTAGGDFLPGLSSDGRTLLWSATMAARPSIGRQDIWMSTRSPGGGND